MESARRPDGPAEHDDASGIRARTGWRSQTPGGRVVQVFNSGSYWIQDDRGAREAPAELADQIRGTVQRDTVPLLLALADGRVHGQTDRRRRR